VLDELAVDILGYRFAGFFGVNRHFRLAEFFARNADEFHVVEPGLPRSPAPAAEEARHFEGVVGAGVELDLDPGPILGARDRRRPPLFFAVDVDEGPAARARDQVLGLDPAAQFIA
jgi:hypothetical protein